jgi:hypothetical protein
VLGFAPLVGDATPGGEDGVRLFRGEADPFEDFHDNLPPGVVHLKHGGGLLASLVLDGDLADVADVELRSASKLGHRPTSRLA